MDKEGAGEKRNRGFLRLIGKNKLYYYLVGGVLHLADTLIV